jgi:hypothetical protein
LAGVCSLGRLFLRGRTCARLVASWHRCFGRHLAWRLECPRPRQRAFRKEAMTHKAVLLVFLLVAPFTTSPSSAQAAVASDRKSAGKPDLAEHIYGRKLHLKGSLPKPPPNGSPKPPAPPPPWEIYASGSDHPWWLALHENYSALAAQSDLPGQVYGRYQSLGVVRFGTSQTPRGGCRSQGGTGMRHIPGSVWVNEGTLTNLTRVTCFFCRDMI